MSNIATRWGLTRQIIGTGTAAAMLFLIATGGAVTTAFAIGSNPGYPDRDNTLLGVDANHNGIRDDIDAYITAEYPAQAHRAAAMQTARAMQWTLQVIPTDLISAKAASMRMTNAVNCVYSKFNHGGTAQKPAFVIEKIRGFTTNTKLHLIAYLDYCKALNGTSSSLPEGNTCD